MENLLEMQILRVHLRLNTSLRELGPRNLMFNKPSSDCDTMQEPENLYSLFAQHLENIFSEEEVVVKTPLFIKMRYEEGLTLGGNHSS